jgi:hypothetical protein
MRYLVQWEIDIEDVDTPQEAAKKAWGLMRTPDSTASVFSVRERGGSGVVKVDQQEIFAREAQAQEIEEANRYENFYRCDACDCEWSDVWSCGCDDECPECGCDTSPHDSIDLMPELDDDAEGVEEDPEFPRSDWRYDVINDDTKLGYLQWLKNKREAASV